MGKILIVDDEPLSARVLQVFFGERGHEAAVAESGLEALETSKTLQPDVLITDFLLDEGMQGDDVVAELRKLRPELVVFVLSGMPPEDLRPRLPPDTHLLTKPVDLDDLAAQVDAALA